MFKALFLDRDGVVNVEKNYVHKIADFEFVEGIFDLLRVAQSSGFLIFIITNQAGIGRGFYTEQDFLQLTQWMLDEFNMRGIDIAKVYYCPFHPENGLGRYKQESFDRKPNPGMILRARAEFNLDLQHSILIGDTLSDIEAGRRAGVGKVLLLDSNPNSPAQSEAVVISSLAEAAMFLLE